MVALTRAGLEGKKVVGYYYSDSGEYSKDRANSDFVNRDSNMRCLVSTIGYGLGVNVKGLTNVVVWGFPGDLLDFWQEAGRGARDGGTGTVSWYGCLSEGTGCDNKEMKEFCLDNNTCYRQRILMYLYPLKDKTFRPPIASDCICTSSQCLAFQCGLCKCCSACRKACKIVH